jgi:hypothetical protein
MTVKGTTFGYLRTENRSAICCGTFHRSELSPHRKWRSASFLHAEIGREAALPPLCGHRSNTDVLSQMFLCAAALTEKRWVQAPPRQPPA